MKLKSYFIFIYLSALKHTISVMQLSFKNYYYIFEHENIHFSTNKNMIKYIPMINEI